MMKKLFILLFIPTLVFTQVYEPEDKVYGGLHKLKGTFVINEDTITGVEEYDTITYQALGDSINKYVQDSILAEKIKYYISQGSDTIQLIGVWNGDCSCYVFDTITPGVIGGEVDTTGLPAANQMAVFTGPSKIGGSNYATLNTNISDGANIMMLLNSQNALTTADLFTMRNNGTDRFNFASSGFMEIFNNATNYNSIQYNYYATYIDNIIRTKLEPATSASSGGTVYLFDTKNDMQSGDTIFGIRNQDIRKFSVDYDGNTDITGNLKVDGNTDLNGILFTGSTKTAGAFYTGTDNPSLTDRLNADVYLHVTALYADGGLLDVDGTQINTNGLLFSGNFKPRIANEVATATNPVFIIDENEVTTGIGGTSSYISSIINGTEYLRVSSTLITSNLDISLGSSYDIIPNSNHGVEWNSNIRLFGLTGPNYGIGLKTSATNTDYFYNDSTIFNSDSVVVKNNLTVDGDSINASNTKLNSKLFIGELYIDGDSTLAIPVAATYYTFKKWNTTGVNVNVTATDSTLTIASGGNGYYNIRHHESVSGIANAIIHASLFVNDTEVTKCEVQRKLAASGSDVGASAGGCIIWLNDGDVLKLKYRTDSSTGTLTVGHSNFSITRIN